MSRHRSWPSKNRQIQIRSREHGLDTRGRETEVVKERAPRILAHCEHLRRTSIYRRLSLDHSRDLISAQRCGLAEGRVAAGQFRVRVRVDEPRNAGPLEGVEGRPCLQKDIKLSAERRHMRSEERRVGKECRSRW